VEWVVENRGASAAPAEWFDTVSIVRGGLTVVLAQAAAPISLSAGSAYTHHVRVTVPLTATFPPGPISLVVTTDPLGLQPDSNPSNNTGSLALTLEYPPLPDLEAGLLDAPNPVLPGGAISLSWTVTNRGPAGLPGPFQQSVYFAAPSAATNPPAIPALYTFAVTNPLPAGAGLAFTVVTNLPPLLPAGEHVFAVLVDSAREWLETTDANNLSVSDPVLIPARLTWMLPTHRLVETAGPIEALLHRNGDSTTALEVAFSSSDPSELVVPASLHFEPGQSLLPILLAPQPDHETDGDQPVTLTAAATGYSSAAVDLTITDADPPRLTLTFAGPSVPEGQAMVAIVHRTGPTTEPLVVTVSSPNASQLILPAPVTIPDGAAQNAFSIVASDDSLVEATQGYPIIVSASGRVAGEAILTIEDDDFPVLAMGSRPPP
jgi:hypothetical protein